MVLLSRRGADSSLAAREAGHRSTVLPMVRIGELENAISTFRCQRNATPRDASWTGACVASPRVPVSTLAGCARPSRDGSSW